MQNTFFCLGKFLQNLADDQCSSIAKGSVYNIKHVYIQPFSMEVDLPEMQNWMEVSTMFYLHILRFYFASHSYWKHEKLGQLFTLIPAKVQNASTYATEADHSSLPNNKDATSLENEFSLNVQIWSLTLSKLKKKKKQQQQQQQFSFASNLGKQ